LKDNHVIIKWICVIIEQNLCQHRAECVSPLNRISDVIEWNMCHHRAKSVSSLNVICIIIEWNMCHHKAKSVSAKSGYVSSLNRIGYIIE